MNLAPLITLFPFAFVMSITPGPNNLMVTASGVNFGFRRTVPHMLGVTIGFPVLLLSIGFGLGRLFIGHPGLQLALKVLGCGYLVWTAYRMAMSRKMDSVEAGAKPISFQSAALFQWINPKAWMMGIAMMTTYSAAFAKDSFGLVAVCAFMGVMSLVAVVTWTLFGTMIAHKLHDPRALRVFNVTMAVALVLSLVPMLR